MIKRTSKSPDAEPEQSSFQLPSEDMEHLFQVTDVYTCDEHPENFNITDPDIVFAKLEVVGGDEEGRSILNRCNLDDTQKAYYFTRMFLKAIGEPYKGDHDVDTENWIGKQFYATVVHDGKYANIDQYNFDKQVEQFDKKEKEVNWDE